ncbi:hypothetical protein M2163_008183 [Streptomyces sp. SAI-135]|uniref:hypothetical protein n=1 Tax=unclassified Streptomyces TaxID=2593676 RepID=UPI00247525B9|nr:MULTISPECIES: hypothetical protein [unclassified Streptomyces]MDH6514842.1 hypothetical protein [Streptomyces sp. SAI-090]MDH6621075.1 hypothetical protein [Streptomyces sp. SAI-135]
MRTSPPAGATAALAPVRARLLRDARADAGALLVAAAGDGLGPVTAATGESSKVVRS